MDSHENLFEKTPFVKILTKSVSQEIKDVSIITISNTLVRITSKGPITISAERRITPLIITTLGPVPYSSDKDVAWNYGVLVYYNGIEQDS